MRVHKPGHFVAHPSTLIPSRSRKATYVTLAHRRFAFRTSRIQLESHAQQAGHRTSLDSACEGLCRVTETLEAPHDNVRPLGFLRFPSTSPCVSPRIDRRW